MDTGDKTDFLGVRISIWFGALFVVGAIVGLRELALVESREGRDRSAQSAKIALRGEASSEEGFEMEGVAVTEAGFGRELPEVAGDDFEGLDLALRASNSAEILTDLFSPVAEVRAGAANGLSQLAFSAVEAVPQLTILARSDPDENVRERATEALFNIRGYGAGGFEF